MNQRFPHGSVACNYLGYSFKLREHLWGFAGPNPVAAMVVA